MSEKIKILFVRPSKSSFIQTDLELLAKHFDVKVVDFILTRKDPKGTFLSPIKMIFGVLWADVTFSWFAVSHAFWAVWLSKILQKKSVIVVGGYEVAKVPEIEYGAMLNPKSTRIVKYVLDNADKVLAVSEFNKKEILKYIVRQDVELIYNGVDCDKFESGNITKDDNVVITVSVMNENSIKRKGLESFIESAGLVPDVRFVVIGSGIDDAIHHLKLIAPPNVEFTGFVSDNELIEWYQKAKVYCQLSLYESFGMALAESMCCECIPVVTNNAALPEVVGNTGFYVPYGDSEATAEAIKKALKSDKGKEARERMENLFSLRRREKYLRKIIDESVNHGKI